MPAKKIDAILNELRRNREREQELDEITKNIVTWTQYRLDFQQYMNVNKANIY